MGTRADFYIDKGKKAEWLGSIAWDGDPESIPVGLFKITDKETFRKKVALFLASRDDGTKPEQGWPWPWDDSRTTDWSYTFSRGKVWASKFGRKWVPPLAIPDDYYDTQEVETFPNMKKIKKVALGNRSGLIILG